MAVCGVFKGFARDSKRASAKPTIRQDMLALFRVVIELSTARLSWTDTNSGTNWTKRSHREAAERLQAPWMEVLVSGCTPPS
ncbi:conserved hypothetical protein [Verticillium alfalfae VaMs.102]|uniref:Uncharacterized protein n=1 Tax=Verticillium alfalfae (strain VaMs.102 / ATCC MYA-4576 / FGSC 10136) TaxID=526221 RepID=C9S605_VERA1|nr:conserved hypothetical protein [Verticillium alfalfae VaMs.102]EEY14344.1 conserved hypothetical protein [Verticillium alfalfae VaMs.102]